MYGLFYAGKIPTLAQHEVNPGLPKSDRLNYIYFTLPVCINFQRSSPAMWKSALETFNDSETNYLFYPEKLAETNIEKIRTDLIKHKLGLQPNKHTEIWTRISSTLHKYFDNDPRKILQSKNFDVVEILKMLQETDKDKFPYLRGNKLSNYWLYILSQYTDIKLKNMHKISIIPDTHVLQSTFKLGLTDKLESPEIVIEVWQELLTGHKITPVQMHPVLWNWSRNNFLPEV
ncbi:MAG TPA: hypothetical protein VLI92_03190 [Candidatus Saccharimonadales bacterium]|nr:hypothetical protein [Candidatus Saccharimonadales bacterium]